MKPTVTMRLEHVAHVMGETRETHAVWCGGRDTGLRVSARRKGEGYRGTFDGRTYDDEDALNLAVLRAVEEWEAADEQP